MQLRNLVRRHKWRLRPVKRAVLPLRNLKRAGVALFRKSPVIARSTAEYAGASLIAKRQIHPAASVSFPAYPFEMSNGGTRSPGRLASHILAPTHSTGSEQASRRPPARELHQATASAEAALIFRLKNIDFWGRYGGSVVTADNCLLADLSPEVWGIENHPIFSHLRLPKRRQLRGRAAIAVTPEAPGNYYHWLIDLLPRICLIRLSDGFESFEHFLINGSHAHYEKASLQALRVPPEKIFYVDARDRFQIEEATIPSMDHFSKVIASWKIEALRVMRNSLARTQDAGLRRLYVSRKRAAVRRIINESEIENILRDAGFTAVDLESCSWTDQVAMFSGAEVVLAPHGAALANTVFCQPGALLAEINTRVGYRDYYLRLAASSGVRYRFIEAQPRVTTSSSIRATENEDMIVDLNLLQDLLRSL